MSQQVNNTKSHFHGDFAMKLNVAVAAAVLAITSAPRGFAQGSKGPTFTTFDAPNAGTGAQ
jgi:hypothetical protein